MPKRCNPTPLLQMNRPRRTKCFKTRGKKSEPHPNPLDPPRCRANKRKGRGTYAKDRPPIVGTVGRESGQVRLRGYIRPTKRRFCLMGISSPNYLPPCMMSGAVIRVSTGVMPRATGNANGHDCLCRWDSRSPHQTIEGFWTTVRNFLRPFRGVHKKFLAGYVQCESFAQS